MRDELVARAKYEFASSIEKLLLEKLNDIKQSDVFFAQVGANDGSMNDPITKLVHKNRWKGILFEPVPCYFEKLRAHYADMPDLILVNGACGDASAVLDFYEVPDTADIPFPWMRGLSSFSRETVRKHFQSEAQFAAHVRQVQVRTEPLNACLDAHGIERCDFLVIDTEGFEPNVLQGIDCERFGVSLVVMEHEHLSPDARDRCVDMLASQGLTPAVGWFEHLFLPSLGLRGRRLNAVAPVQGAPVREDMSGSWPTEPAAASL